MPQTCFVCMVLIGERLIFTAVFSQLIVFDRMVTLKPAVGTDPSGLYDSSFQ